MTDDILVTVAKNFLANLEIDASGANIARMIRGIRRAHVELAPPGMCWVNGTSRGPCSCEGLYSVQTPAQIRAVTYCSGHAARAAHANGALDPFADA